MASGTEGIRSCLHTAFTHTTSSTTINLVPGRGIHIISGKPLLILQCRACPTHGRADGIFLLVKWVDETSTTATLFCVYHDVGPAQWQSFRFTARHIKQHGHRSTGIKLRSWEATSVEATQAIDF